MRVLDVNALTLILAMAVVAQAAGAGPAAATDCLPPPAGLASWYTGDDQSHDLAGANHALAHGALAYVAGQVGDAFGFDGASEYLGVLDSADLDIGVADNFTIAAWMLFQARSSSPQFILEKRQLLAPGDARGLALFLQDGRVALQLNDGSGRPTSSAAAPTFATGRSTSWRWQSITHRPPATSFGSVTRRCRGSIPRSAPATSPRRARCASAANG
ncbi:MAG: hypothetical protein IPK64_00840 [bacterium]|nr:hypothetical protein [bacterium]